MGREYLENLMAEGRNERLPEGYRKTLHINRVFFNKWFVFLCLTHKNFLISTPLDVTLIPINLPPRIYLMASDPWALRKKTQKRKQNRK
jgi:hypothetical protein